MGSVAETIGPEHQSDLCELGCAADHAFAFVRIAPRCRQASGKRIDLKLDLHPRLHVSSPCAWLTLPPTALLVSFPGSDHLACFLDR